MYVCGCVCVDECVCVCDSVGWWLYKEAKYVCRYVYIVLSCGSPLCGVRRTRPPRSATPH